MDWLKRTTHNPAIRHSSQRGNAIMMIFMAIGMAGVVTYGLNNIMRGPAVTAAEASRRTIAANNLVATTRLAITAAARQQTNGGDCDSDGFVEPLPFRAPTTEPVPAGGGLVPMSVGASMTDPWGNQYGYCVWDPGTESKSDANAACGGAGANRLEGAPRDDQPAIAVISAGRNGVFETSCNAYVDTTPADNKPDTALVNKPGTSDDVVLSYTYAEANGVGGGLWKISQDPFKPNTAEIGMNIKSTSTGGATFSGKVELKNKGLVLPGDPGDDTVTGACDAAKDGQLRRNTSTSPATIEMCDNNNGNGWIQISGSAAPVAADPSCYFGPFSNVAAGPGPSYLYKIGDYIYGGGWNNNLFASVSTASPTSPTLSTLNDATNFNYSRFTVGSGSYAYVTAPGSDRLTVVNITDPANMSVAGSVTNAFLDSTEGLALNGTYVYATSGTADRFNVIDVSNPASPSLTSSVQDNTWLNNAGAIQLKDQYAVVAAGDNITLVDVSTPASPTVFSHVNIGENIWDIAVKGDYLYVAAQSKIYIVDLSTAATPTVLGTLNSPLFSDLTDVVIFGKYLFVAAATYGDQTNAQVIIIDLSTPASPQIVNNFTQEGVEYIAFKGQYLYTTGLYLSVWDAGCDPLVGGGTPPASGGSGTTSGALKILPDPLDAGLIANWKFNNLLGDPVIKDYAGDNDGSVVNLAARGFGQTVDGNYTFDSVDDDGIMVPGLLGEPPSLTIAGWVNISDYTNITGGVDGATIFSIGDYVGIADYYDDETDGNTGLSFYYYDGGTWASIQSTPNLVSTGWHYITATIDDTEAVFRLYLDGVLLAQSDMNSSVHYNGLGSNTYFGMHGNAENYDMSGAVDDFRVYNRALSPGEIQDLYKRESVNGIQAPSLLAVPTLATQSMKLSTGLGFTCAIKSDGTPWCWGQDNNQQLGNSGSGVGTSQASPVPVTEPTTQVYYLTGNNSDLTGVKKLVPYLETAKANTGPFAANASVSIIGTTISGLPGLDDGSGKRPYSVTVYTGAAQPCISASVNLRRANAAGTIQGIDFFTPSQMLTSTTTTFTGNLDLGTFAATDRISVEVAMTETCGASGAPFDVWAKVETPLQDRSPWTSISVGGSTHACGVKGNGSAWCWGWDGDYALGNSGFASGLYSEPSRVVDTGAPWVSIASNELHTCAIQGDGTLWCWGNDADGELGNGAATGLKADPQKVGTDTDWAQVSIGYAFSCAIKTNGLMYCWGDDTNGQLANGASPSADQISPYLVPDPGPWQKVSAGNSHACGIKADGSMWCWGLNSYYALGSMIGTSYLPVKVSTHPDNWVDVSAGWYHTCGVDRTGTAWCWGASNNGRLGAPGIVGNTYIPRRVYGLSEVAGISAGGNHTCAVKTNGAVSCWGSDQYGQLGNGTSLTADMAQPYPVEGFPSTPTWGWDNAYSVIKMHYGMSVGLGTGYLSDTMGRGFGFSSAGRARVVQNNDSNQLLINSTGANTGSQLSFMNEPGPGVQDVTNGLVAKWPLDTNGNATVGASINGTVGGGATFDSTRYKVGTGAVVFDGNDDYIQVPRAALEEPTYLSVSFWMRRAGNQLATDETTILAKVYNDRTAAPYVSYMFSLFGQRLQFTTGHTSNSRDFILTDIPDEKWVFVTGTYNKDVSGATRKKLYINGELKASSGVNTLLKYDTSATTGRLYLGGKSGAPNGFVGALDDVRIYNRQLSDAEVRQLYQYYLGSQTPRTIGVDYANDQFEIGRNNATATNYLNTINPDIAITTGGNVGMGLGATAPAAKLDVGGGVRFGTEETCDSNRTGAIRYTGGTPPWTYCNGTSWTSFPSAGNATWKKSKGTISGGSCDWCMVRSTGYAYCMGCDQSFGEYGINLNGDDNMTGLAFDQPVHSSSSSTGWNDWVQIDAATEHSCGVRADGSAWCWGWSNFGELGNGTSGAGNFLRPVQVMSSSWGSYWYDWLSVQSSDHDYTCGLRTNGTAWCWGRDINGQLGDGNSNTAPVTVPVQVENTAEDTYWSDYIDLAVGAGHNCGIRVNGSLYCWGAGTSGQLGNGANGDSSLSVQVKDSAGTGTWSDWIKVDAGNGFTCGIRADGSMWCWGDGTNGRLGRGSNTSTNLPRQVQQSGGGSTYWYDWVFIGMSDMASGACGIRSNGQAYCWGAGVDGELCDGGSADSNLPKLVLDDDGVGSPNYWSDWVNVEMGYLFFVGTRADGVLRGCGEGQTTPRQYLNPLN